MSATDPEKPKRRKPGRPREEVSMTPEEVEEVLRHLLSKPKEGKEEEPQPKRQEPDEGQG